MAHFEPRELQRKAAAEFREFLQLSIYLWICFGAVLSLKVAVLQAHGVTYLPYGFAVVKALLCAKFVLLGHVFGVARSHPGEPLVRAIARKSFALLLVLIALTVMEEVVIALFERHSFFQALGDLGGGTPFQMAATIAILLLVLIPYVAFRALGEALGEAELHRLLFRGGQTPPGSAGNGAR